MTYCSFFHRETLGCIVQQPRSCKNGRGLARSRRGGKNYARSARNSTLAIPTFNIFLRLCNYCNVATTLANELSWVCNRDRCGCLVLCDHFARIHLSLYPMSWSCLYNFFIDVLMYLRHYAADKQHYFGFLKGLKIQLCSESLPTSTTIGRNI